jgi:outer membrane protein
LAAGFGGSSAVEMGGDWDLQAAATMTWNLWTAGRLSAAGGAAAEALAATEWQKEIARDVVIYTTESAYNGVLLAAEQVDIAEQARAAATEALRVTQAAFDEGTAANFDLLRSRVELANREAPVVQARNQWHIQTLQLLRICGLDPNTTLTLGDPLAPVSGPDELASLLSRMRANSPELQTLSHVVAAQRQSVSLAKAARGPIVQLQGQYALQGQWDDDIIPTGDESVTSANVALAVSLPIFDGFTTKAGIQRSEANLRNAEIELERVTRDRELSVRQARLNLENTLVALDGRQETVDLAAEAYRLALVRVENGMATALERLDAELALTEARVQLAESLYNCNLAEAGLKLAVGGTDSNAPAAEEN